MLRVPSLFTWIQVCVALASLSVVNGAVEPKRGALTVKQILDRMAETYANSLSYRDSGTITIDFITAKATRRDRRAFITAFVRPDRFRFEHRGMMKDLRYIIWRGGEDVRIASGVEPVVETVESIGLALASATGVSAGSSHTVPALLLPREVGGRRLTDISEGTRREDLAHGGAECYVIGGKFGDASITVWIEKEAFLLRRIEEQHSFDKFRTETTTIYDPVINVESGEEMLQFDVDGKL